MLNRILAAAAAAIFTFLACILLGGLLNTVAIPPVQVLGAFLVQWATALAILAAIVAFLGGGFSWLKVGGA